MKLTNILPESKIEDLKESFIEIGNVYHVRLTNKIRFTQEIRNIGISSLL
jgi:hypothetical protein